MLGSIKKIIISFLMAVSFVGFSTVFMPVQTNAACSQSTFLGLPSWYKYLDSTETTDGLTGGTTCNVNVSDLSDVWLVVAAIVEILLRVAALVALVFVIYGGVSYITSQSQPDKVNQALKTTVNALIGLVITIVAAAVVSFIAGSFN